MIANLGYQQTVDTSVLSAEINIIFIDFGNRSKNRKHLSVLIILDDAPENEKSDPKNCVFWRVKVTVARISILGV